MPCTCSRHPPGSAWSSPLRGFLMRPTTPPCAPSARWQGALAGVGSLDLAVPARRRIGELIETLRLRGGGTGLCSGCAAGDVGTAAVRGSGVSR